MNPEKSFAPDKTVPLLSDDSETKFVSSDINAFLSYAGQSIPLDDGEYAVLSPEAYYIKDIATGDERNDFCELAKRSGDALSWLGRIMRRDLKF
jgi:glucosamine 6-phosphate synthetase-like amidotransferase/phosphosugar isomerase protein